MFNLDIFCSYYLSAVRAAQTCTVLITPGLGSTGEIEGGRDKERVRGRETRKWVKGKNNGRKRELFSLNFFYDNIYLSYF